MGSRTSKLENTYLNLKLATGRMRREAKKRESEEKKSLAKVKQYLREGKVDVAKIHAENAIRQRNEAINFLTLASRLDGVQARVKEAMAAQMMTKQMQQVVKGMHTALNSLNVDKVSSIMTSFEEKSMDIEVVTKGISNGIATTVSGMNPETETNELLQQAGEAVGLDYLRTLEEGTPVPIGLKQRERPEAVKSQKTAVES